MRKSEWVLICGRYWWLDENGLAVRDEDGKYPYKYSRTNGCYVIASGVKPETLRRGLYRGTYYIF